ncbi:hypothetical protein QBC33DRAFT_518938 [Phialemonium atrogriseum]|uniref:Fork-head domain-containing protein n=1 Tax=Phialemonium atrogriseum TaxID=1093897 RepID=A0AAJ0FIC1_9PEZI|nr:uncharacterized protein QBC33DRAFT_518938 [Phialemonium atrogriseum]KAK1763139.1 hypothetical protein QBC33DRAFT_518938 [Phialemonium atrogriseum]
MSPTWSISSAPDHFRGSFDFPSGAAAQISFPCQQPPGPQQQYPHHQYPGGGIAGGAPTNTMVSFPSSGPQPTTTGVSSDYDESPLMGLASATTTSPSGGRHPTGDDQNKNNNNNNNNTTVVGDSSSAGCTGRNAATTTGGKEEPEPYARLIHRAFMSCPGRPMTLQEIYQWFRENTDKDKSESKGWQNSIRHNLSMNAAFTKPERLSNGAPGPKDDNDEDGGGGGGGGEESSPRAGAGKKSTEWILEQWAARDGVQSTTRYRNSPRRGGAGKASSAGSRPKKKGPAKRGVAGTAAAAQAAEWEADVQQQQGRRRQRQAQKQALLQRQELQGQYIPVAPAMEHHQQQDQYQHQYHGLPMPLTLPMHIHNRHHNDHHHQQQLSTFLPSTYGGKTPDFPGYSPPPSSSAAATMSLFNTPPPPPPPPPSSSAGSVVPATVKSEAEEADEAMTPAESGFAFREPGVLLPELQQVGGGDVVAVYGGAGRVVDVSQYGLGSVAGVYEEGLFQGCVWDPEASYDQC